MEEPKVTTIDGVMDSTVMHINEGNPLFARESKGNPHRTQGEPSNLANYADLLLLISQNRLLEMPLYIAYLISTSLGTLIRSGAHYPERATSTYSCNGVFTSKFIFRYAFPAKIPVPCDVMTSASLQI